MAYLGLTILALIICIISFWFMDLVGDKIVNENKSETLYGILAVSIAFFLTIIYPVAFHYLILALEGK